MGAIATIRFASSTVSRTVVVEPSPQPETLLAVARAHGIPILFNCEGGCCGACLVRIERLAEAADANLSAPALTDSERFMLQAMGRLAEGADAAPDAAGGCLRLACQYPVGEGRLAVHFKTDIDSD
jgi:ferredoxin